MDRMVDAALGIIGVCLAVFVLGGIIRLGMIGFKRFSQVKSFRWLSKI
ncbi:hypothetical protein ES703_121126 [subsurface metagenome]